MNVDSILISDYATTIGGKLIVVGVFDRILAKKIPPQIPQLSLSLVIHGRHDEAGTEHQVEIKLVNARREHVLEKPVQFSFKFGPPDDNLPGLPIRFIQTFTMLTPVFEESGPYAFEVYIDDVYHHGAALYVIERG